MKVFHNLIFSLSDPKSVISVLDFLTFRDSLLFYANISSGTDIKSGFHCRNVYLGLIVVFK